MNRHTRRDDAMRWTWIFCVGLIGMGLAAPAAGQDAKMAATIDRQLKKPPASITMIIDYRKIDGLSGDAFQWHAKGTSWWIRLHPSDRYPMAELDKTSSYKIEGVVLEQNYGVLDVWARKVEKLR